MNTIESILLSLKDKALEATRTGDIPFYREYLDDSAIAVVPSGLLSKEDILSQMRSHSRFKSSKIEDTRAIVLSPQSGIVTYKASFTERGDGEDRTVSMFVTTVYAKKNGVWKGVLYQQTPLPEDFESA